MQVSKFSSKDPDFPDVFRHLDEPPENINILGILTKDPMISIVGSRRPTPYGEQVTHQLATELARAGATIVSGLAIGIDGIAHRAALDAGGRTIAVLAHGLDRVYPARHRELAKDILASGGALISEYDFGVPPLPHHFLQRNRLIAALGEATIVTEAAQRSGSLVTATAAINTGRLVMAVPGNITSVYSSGPNNLIRTGAIPVVSGSDVLSALGYEVHETAAPNSRNADEAVILDLLSQGACNSQAIIDSSGLSAAKFAHVIGLMEITGKVRNLGAGTWTIR